MSSAPVKKDAFESEIPDPTNILLFRLEHWKQAVTLLTDYVESLASIQRHNTAGFEKAKKAIIEAPKFDYAETPASGSGATAAATATTTTIGALPTADGAAAPDADAAETSGPVGIAESFNNMRMRTEALINKSIEAEAQFKQAILPQLATLKGDIEKHLKSLKGPGLKNQKEVDRARAITQKEVESLGQHTSSYGAGYSDNPNAKNDPYVIRRNVLSSLADQVIKENSQADGILSIQNNFQTLERHIVQVLQQAIYVLSETVNAYTTAKGEALQAISDKFQEIQPDYEWNNFSTHNKDVLIPEGAEKRDIEQLTFANDTHPSTVPVVEGILQRKSTVIKQYNAGYFVLTPSRFLHQFKSKSYAQDPNPEFSLYLPACTLGAPSAQNSGKYKIIITGKEKGKTIPIAKKHNFVFKTNTYSEMMQWHSALSKLVGINSTEPVVDNIASPVQSPVLGPSETASIPDSSIDAAVESPTTPVGLDTAVEEATKKTADVSLA